MGTDPTIRDAHRAPIHDPAMRAEPKDACDVTRTRRITLDYSGLSNGSGPLSHGQDNMARCMGNDEPSSINQHAIWPVPAEADLPAALAALRTLAERHESLRTVFPAGPEAPDHLPVSQVLKGEGEFTVTLVETGTTGVADPDDAELDAMVDELTRADRAVGFDLAEDFPLRFTMLLLHDRPVRMGTVVCHTGADGASTAMLVQEWFLLASGKELPPVSGRTPLEVAAAEHSAMGRRRSRTALKHWERLLRTGPQAVFADSRITGPAGPVSTLLIRSRAAGEALDAASRRVGSGPSTVVLAAFAALVAHRAGQQDLVFAAHAANRHRPGLADSIGNLAQDALLSLHTDADDLDELIGRTKAASLSGYWHSGFEAAKVWEMIEDIAHLRGSRYSRQVSVNDLSLSIPEAAAAARPLALSDPELNWFPDSRAPTRLALNIVGVTDSLEFALVACPQVLNRDETVQFAEGLLALVSAAAHGPVPLGDIAVLTGIRAGVRTGDWHLVDGSWIELDAVRDLLVTALGAEVRPRVAVVDQRLVADLDSDTLTPTSAHLATVAALPGHDTAMAPQHYVVHGLGPDAPVTAGHGRDPQVTDWQQLLG